MVNGILEMRNSTDSRSQIQRCVLISISRRARARVAPRLITLLTFCSLAASTMAQVVSPEELVELCKRTLCRAPQVKLFVDETRNFERQLAPLPILQSGFLAIYAGDKLFIEATVAEGNLKLDRAVSINERPETTLQFEFAQMSGSPDMMLRIKNPFPTNVRFRMGMMLLDSSSIYETSSCLVPANLSLVEHWPHPIFALILDNPQVVASTSSMNCK